MSKEYWPNLYNNLPYKLDQDFLGRQALDLITGIYNTMRTGEWRVNIESKFQKKIICREKWESEKEK